MDTLLNAPTSLINGLVTGGASILGKGLSAVGATGIGGALQMGAEKTAKQGVPGYGGQMTGQAPTSAVDATAKIAETGADVPMFSFVAGGLFEGILFTGTTGLTDSFILLRVMFALIPTILFNLTAIS